MPDNKNHHYVPQSYLRRFGMGNSVSLFNLHRRQHIQNASIPGQCQRAYLYGRDGEVERALEGIESACSPTIRGIIQSDTLPAVSSPEYHRLMEFISYQHERTPDAAEVLTRTMDKLSDALAKTIAGDDDLPGSVLEHLRQLSQSRMPSPLAQTLKIAKDYAALLLDLEPSLILNTTSVEFITSDCPAVLFNPWCRGWHATGVTGLASSGLTIFLPLSPRHVLLLADSDVYSIRHSSSRVVRVSLARDVKGINATRLFSAELNLYYSGNDETRQAIDDLPLHGTSRASSTRE